MTFTKFDQKSNVDLTLTFIEVDVGVDYGTPAQRVIDLLVGVAKANPKVIDDPEPHAFFVNFGDSALEFKLCED